MKHNTASYWLFVTIFILIMVSCSTKNQNNVALVKNETVKSEDGVEISYYTKGTGDISLVFVHGWSCDKSYWKYQVDYFAKNYHVVALDLAGHGESGMERSNYTFRLFGADVASVVNKLKLKKVILIGHSMGGPVNFEAYNRLGDKVLGLIGVDTYQEMAQSYPKEMRINLLKGLKTHFKQSVEQFVLPMFQKNADPQLVGQIVKDMSSAPPKVAYSSMENMFNWMDMRLASTLDPELLKMNIKAVNADLWPTNIKGNRTLFPKFEVKIIKGYGHFLHLEVPDQFNKKLEEFIIQFK